jgi:serine-type D-Ala-D-Ala carboxypeptidase (penicillin-binding protein 5/6)
LRKRVLKQLISITLIFVLSITLLPNVSHADKPFVSAQTSILMEQESGRVLFEKNMHKKMRIASITKIMTAILAAESGMLDETVTVSKRAAYTEGSSIYLKPGEKIKLKHLVYGLMLRSGNDAAVSIAEHVGGSLEGFVFLMNQKAEEIGMENTYFSNPHGLDDHEKHYSTAYDMAVLTRYAMLNETYRKISSTTHYRSPRDWKADDVWKNKNKLLTTLYEYCTGGKTGYTKRARRTLVTTASKGKMDLIVVTLNDGNDWNDHKNLYEWGFNNFEMTTIVKEGVVENIDDEFYKDYVTVKNPFRYPLTSQEKTNIKLLINLYEPNKSEWETTGIPSPVGKMNVLLKDKKIGEVSLFYDAVQSSSHHIESMSFLQRLFHVFQHVLGVKTNG